MKYGFSDILNEEVYKDCYFAVITCRSYLFINMVIDTFKGIAIDDDNVFKDEYNLDDEFGLGESQSQYSNYVSIDTFKDVVNSPSINGKWLCVCDIKTLSKKQLGFIENYKRNPSRHGILLVYGTEYRDYKNYLKDVVLNGSKHSHIISMNYINTNTLSTIVDYMFKQKGIVIDVNAMRYFIVKVGREYDSIDDMIDLVVEESAGGVVSILEVKRALKGIDNFSIDDFIQAIVEGKSTKKVCSMLAAMVMQYGSVKLVSKLEWEINTLMDFRKYINSGAIPVSIGYIYNDCIKEIGKDSRIAKLQEKPFRYKALLAAQTSMRDLVYIKMILNGASGTYNEEICFRALYDVVFRKTMWEDRINNIIGITDVIERAYTEMDKYECRMEDEE